MHWKTIIGLEVHAQLKTNSKLFSPASTLFGEPANSMTHYIDAALPGTLPVLNRQAIHLALQFGLAIHATIQNHSYFERKHYTYPDLPKGYQITQHKRPILIQGYIDIPIKNMVNKRVTIRQAHLEEDAGKSIHDEQNGSLIDLNRAGIPLLEIVTEPCLNTAEEAVQFLKTLHQLLRFLDISDGNMQTGSFRCDVNLSLCPTGESTMGTRTEIKNLNSFRFIEKAIQTEIVRQQAILESGQLVKAETRLYCSKTNTTHSMRNKETTADYRYFPDPDLLPIIITQHDIQQARSSLKETPETIRQHLSENPQLSNDDITFLLTSPEHVAFFHAIKKHSRASTQMIMNWLRGPYAALLNEQQKSLSSPPISAEKTAQLLDEVVQQRITVKQAQKIFHSLSQKDQSLDELILENTNNRFTIDEETLVEIISPILLAYPQQTEALRTGEEKILAFFMGKIMKETQDRVNPKAAQQCLLRLVSLTKSHND